MRLKVWRAPRARRQVPHGMPPDETFTRCIPATWPARSRPDGSAKLAGPSETTTMDYGEDIKHPAVPKEHAAALRERKAARHERSCAKHGHMRCARTNARPPNTPIGTDHRLPCPPFRKSLCSTCAGKLPFAVNVSNNA